MISVGKETAQSEPIHHATVFGRAGYTAATACGRTEQPKPATDVAANVTCKECQVVLCLDEALGRVMAVARVRVMLGPGISALVDRFRPMVSSDSEFLAGPDMEPWSWELTDAGPARDFVDAAREPVAILAAREAARLGLAPLTPDSPRGARGASVIDADATPKDDTRALARRKDRP